MEADEAPDPTLDVRLARGGPVIVGAQAVKTVLRFGSMVLMARMVSPEAYGVFGMAAVVYGLFQTGRDLGLGAAGVQRTELAAVHADALFWLLALAGLAQAGLMAGLSVLLAGFYHEPGLPPLMAALALALLLANLGTAFRVHLLREMRYPAVAWVELASSALSLALALGAAAGGLGYWALAVTVVGLEFFNSLGYAWLSVWRPGGGLRWSAARDLMGFAAGVTGFSYANYAALFLDQFLIGRWFGPLALGLYGRAGQLATLPGAMFFGPLTGWMMHALSRLRDQPEEFRSFYRRVIGGLMHACCPLGALLMAAPEPCLRLLLGHAWVDAAPILRALALGLFFLPFSFADVWVLLGCGASRSLLLWSLARLAALAGALWLARDHGLTAVAWALSATTVILNLASCLVVRRFSPVCWSDYRETIWRPLLLGAGWGLALWQGLRNLPQEYAVLLGGALVYALALWLWPKARAEVLELRSLVRPAHR